MMIVIPVFVILVMTCNSTGHRYHYIECCYAECYVMQSVFMLSVLVFMIMLGVG
jgi:hypothetical protein